MPGLVDMQGAPPPSGLGYSVSHQKVELDIDFTSRSIKGKTEITIHPDYKDLKLVRLNFRQGQLKRITVGGKTATSKYVDPYEALQLYGVQYHRKLSTKLDALSKTPPEPELVITIPKSVRIEELDPFSVEAQTQLSLRATSGGANGTGGADDTVDGNRAAEATLPRFTAITILIEFTIEKPRDGIQFVGLESRDLRYPHAYTTNSSDTGEFCCLFPCVDDMSSRCTWDISIRCPRTLGDLFPRSPDNSVVNGTSSRTNSSRKTGLSAEDAALDMVVACSGDLTDDILDPKDQTKKTVSFSCNTPLSAPQIGFALGPFEYVNLSQFRESDEDDQLGANAVPVHAFCLPGRADEVRNTCLPMAKAVDFISLTYGSYPFASFKLCFVDDLRADTLPAAGFTLCSDRILFPENIIDMMYDSTRRIVHSLAYQWVGINIIPKDPTDTWVITGISYYIADTFMKKIGGNNEYRYRQKLLADRVVELDVLRPSLWDMGAILKIDPSEMEFISLKAPLVLYILERRLSKASGKATISRIISRIFLNARMGDLPNCELTSAHFQKLCERMGHTKLDAFFSQWVYGAGCPRFTASQRFNKKKLVVEMMISQVQSEQTTARDLERSTFMRDVKEEIRNVYAGTVQNVFTGSMTIQIHEADGTPYEHIVEIKEAITKFDIPYNTKYKRLKRNRRQKERAAAMSGIDPSSETQDDVLLYCLGDVLQSDEDMEKWRIVEWTKEDESRMGQESYEWIRMDADFEWICKMSLGMPGYMYLSQLQQDRDVVAQLESIQHMAAQREHALISSIFVRTILDRRYFHGIRTAATKALVKHAKQEVDWIGLFHLENAFQELYCLPNSSMARSNDFSDRSSYAVQLALIEAISEVRDEDGRTPMRVKQFLYEKLKFNDNSNNEYSDCFYISTLLKSICNALLGRRESRSDDGNFDINKEIERQAEEQLDKDCIAEIDRYRRIDEWAGSFRNIFSRTSLDCQKRLMKARMLDVDIVQFAQYTRAGILEELRLKAFEILLEFKLFEHPELITWYIYNMSADPSPWIRRNLYRMFGEALGAIAFGTESETSGSLDSSLVIEQESSTEARQVQLARRQTVPGALDALKQELGSNKTLKEALWAACNSPRASLVELCDFIYAVGALYHPAERALVRLKYPRYWKTQHLGNGKMKFFKSDRFRTRPVGSTTTTTTTTSKATTAPVPTPTVKRKREQDTNGTAPPLSHRLTLKVPKLGTLCSPSPQPPPPSSAVKPKIKLKLKAKSSNFSPSS
ncbi:Transcription initiation factor TFIID subunit [Trichophyton interdigitale]|uniref:Transcription initiation factor TFIID subunit 2 n=1 Tax=Trichophyton interdigitale TaxID=101480 RepID=A0A9P4YMV4_9EURO|nr:Transcription initiation factor TFIID subunit [Trichophyton interdigitale]KAF3900633.1 Transcription initiation factor TFIID subunit [Trichophyton interdigitale]KAG8211567.1 Transcription initiation factor TFIID subunit [Trichophyton interdigitale]